VALRRKDMEARLAPDSRPATPAYPAIQAHGTHTHGILAQGALDHGTHFSDPSPFSRPRRAPTHDEISAAAYQRAAARGFAPGHEVEDWLAAERELTALLGPERIR
jgi:hypothetical protein